MTTTASQPEPAAPANPAGFRYDGYYNRDRLATLLDAVGDMSISDSERRTLYWLSDWELHTIENVAALLTRARQAG